MMKFLISLMIFSLTVCQANQAGSAEIWQQLKSEHFIIYYKDAPLDFVINVQSEAEQYYHEISDNLGFTRYAGWSYDHRAKIYIYNDQDDYFTNAGAAKWSHGVASIQKRE